MPIPLPLAAATAATALIVGSGALVARGSSGTEQAQLDAEARAVATSLIQALNARQYDRACLLMASAETHERCALGLRVAFLWSQEIRFAVTGVRLVPGGAVVEALADGAPGSVVLVRRDGRLRVARLDGP